MNILITGASRGIGLACVYHFLKLGHHVIGIDLNPSNVCDCNYHHIIGNIEHENILPDMPKIDVLINNAGVQNSGRDIDINLKGTIRMTEKYGIHKDIHSILFMASASAQTGAEFPEYVASKAGMVGYMKNVAQRVAEYGATCNSLSAGGVVTPLNNHILCDDDMYQAVLDETLLKSWASADEIAQFAYFMTMINNSMTGQDILVDNGEALKSNFIW